MPGLGEAVAVGVTRSEVVRLDAPVVTLDGQHVVVVAAAVVPHDLGAGRDGHLSGTEGVVEHADLFGDALDEGDIGSGVGVAAAGQGADPQQQRAAKQILVFTSFLRGGASAGRISSPRPRGAACGSDEGSGTTLPNASQRVTSSSPALHEALDVGHGAWRGR